MPQQKITLSVLIIFMSSGQQQLNFLRMKIQDNAELQQIVEYLRTYNKLPFRNCIFTTKPAQKGQFTMQKTIKEIVPQCKIKDDAAVLLCYESQVQSQIDDQVIESEPSKMTQNKSQNQGISPRKDPKKQQSNCAIF